MIKLNYIVDIPKLIKGKRYYHEKKEIMTASEKKFYKTFCDILGDNYIVWPQINLASIIDKKGKYKKYKPKYRNELFHNIDFGIFSNETLELLLLIEINDKSHLTKKIFIRDKKVSDLCEKCGYRLIKFWTNEPNKYEYIKERLEKYLNKE